MNRIQNNLTITINLLKQKNNNQIKNKIEELIKQNKELALKKKEDIKNFSLISDEDDEIDKKNNKENITYEKIYNDLILKTDLLKQKENELSLLLEKSKKLEDNIKELNKLIDEKNKNIEEPIKKKLKRGKRGPYKKKKPLIIETDIEDKCFPFISGKGLLSGEENVNKVNQYMNSNPFRTNKYITDPDGNKKRKKKARKYKPEIRA